MVKFIKTYLVGAQVNKTAQGLHLIPWYNKEASHTLPPSINILYETLLQYLIPGQNPTITVHNHPIPQDDSSAQIGVVQITLIISCLLLVPLTVPFIGASYVLFPIHERVSNSKLLQLMNGLSSFTFWSASYLFDIVNHLLATLILFIVFIIFDTNKVFWGSGIQ
jgi:ATP-binding cassette subfamily A (ABC1) protein 3